MKIIERFKDLTLIEKLICFYVALIPVMRVPDLPFISQKVQFSEIIFLLMIIVWFIGLIKKKYRLKNNFLTLPIILIAAAFSISSINAELKTASLLELSGILYLLLMVYFVSIMISGKKSAYFIMDIWVYTAFFVSSIGMLAILDWLFFKRAVFLLAPQPGLTSVLPFPRIHSTFRMGSMLASYLHISIIFAFIRFIEEPKGKKRVFLAIAIIMFFIVSLLTASRPLLGIIVSIFLILLKLRGKVIYSVLRYSVFVLLVFVILWSAAITLWVVVPVNYTINQNEMSFSLKVHYPASLYMHLFDAAARMFKDHPITGVGIGMFNEKVIDYVDWQRKDVLLSHFYRNQQTWHGKSDPHSTYLGWAAETGALGLLAVMFLIILYLRKMWALSEHPGAQIKTLVVCYMAGMSGILINAFYIDILTMRHFWFFIALGLVFYNYSQTNTGEQER
ncbi:MAG: O-antigen ligase family protein [Candidatus Omnitrophota bacterium]|jgi:O-antigen ligase|nr:MAG: O-antigen ligase family protein [Candidatus Omnitrophota bacterium]